MGSKERPRAMQKKGAKPEMKAKGIPRAMQKKEAKPEMKAKRRPKPMQKEANLRVRPCAWGLICPGAV